MSELTISVPVTISFLHIW